MFITTEVRIPLMVRCTRYNIIWQSFSVTSNRSVVFTRYSGFLHQYSWSPRYNWNIVESEVKPPFYLLVLYAFYSPPACNHITKQTSLSQKLTTILTEANQYGRLVLLNAMCLSKTQHGHHHIMIGENA
jgi:hypothetical protein